MNRKDLRRACKKRAKTSLKNHYLMYVFVLVLATIIGVAYSSGSRYTEISYAVDKAVSNLDQGKVIGGKTIEELTDSDVYSILMFGEIDLGENAPKPLEAVNRITEYKIGNVSLGRRNGVFAEIVNKIQSGSIFVTIYDTVLSVTGSESVTSAILVIFATLFAAFVWFFIKRVYIIIYTRVFLEGRKYKKVPLTRFTYLFLIKKWMHVAIAFMWCSLWQFLWDLTIVGGFIKHYSYSMVPYLLAENPQMTGREALDLSKKMMYGHKWDMFVFDLSFIPWELLDFITFGLLGVFFLYPYEEASRAEFYAEMRTLAKAEMLPGSGLMNDVYLYEQAPLETLKEVYSDVTSVLHDGLPRLPKRKGFAGVLQDFFGIIPKYDEKEKEYREKMSVIFHVSTYEAAADGLTYPVRLFPIQVKEKETREERLHYMRHYPLPNVVVIFFICSFIGWVWEVCFHLVEDGVFVNRGVMHGPWLPIYGFGGVMIAIALFKLRRKPAIEFIAIVVLCGIVEYMTGWALETIHGERWWDYTGYFLNINGRVCAEGLLVFGIGGMAGVYFLFPFLDNQLSKVNGKIITAISVVLIVLFVADKIYSEYVPNTGEGITEYEIPEEADTDGGDTGKVHQGYMWEIIDEGVGNQ